MDSEGAGRRNQGGEFALIDELARALADARSDAPMPGLVIGIGDDCAALLRDAGAGVYTTDTLVDGVHFRAGQIPWRDLGWKAIAVNLSDIAAMGARPEASLVTLGVTGGEDVTDLVEMYHGIAEATGTHGGDVIGGDVVRSPVLFVTVAMVGTGTATVGGAAFNRSRLLAGSMTGASAGSGYPTAASQMTFDRASEDPAGSAALLRRDAAAPGDLIAVTGVIGDSAGGMQALADGLTGEAAETLKRAHFRPQPRLAQGQRMVAQGVLAAMDVSDGLVDDLGKLCRASGVAATLQSGRVPVSDSLKKCCPERWLAHALGGGEDYELLFTAPRAVMDAVVTALEMPATVIGKIVEGEPGDVRVLDERGRPMEVAIGGWDHLRG